MSTQEIEQQQSRLKELIAKGKEQGFVTYAEVNDHLPDDIADPDQIEDIIRMINDMGITVYETAPDPDELLATEESTADELAAEEAAAALALVETEAGRTTDPVRMYMREMGTVELLTREGEITIAKRIEEGIRDMLSAAAYFPGTVEYALDAYAQASGEGGRLSDLLIGYLDPTDDVPEATQMGPEPKGASEEDELSAEDATEEEEDRGPDPEEAKRRFTALKRQHAKTQKVLKEKGRTSADAQTQLAKLGELFSPFKLVPRHFDAIMQIPQDALQIGNRQVLRLGQMPVPGDVAQEIDTAESLIDLTKQFANRIRIGDIRRCHQRPPSQGFNLRACRLDAATIAIHQHTIGAVLRERKRRRPPHPLGRPGYHGHTVRQRKKRRVHERESREGLVVGSE